MVSFLFIKKKKKGTQLGCIPIRKYIFGHFACYIFYCRGFIVFSNIVDEGGEGSRNTPMLISAKQGGNQDA